MVKTVKTARFIAVCGYDWLDDWLA